jgi:hypothetical protein
MVCSLWMNSRHLLPKVSLCLLFSSFSYRFNIRKVGKHGCLALKAVGSHCLWIFKVCSKTHLFSQKFLISFHFKQHSWSSTAAATNKCHFLLLWHDQNAMGLSGFHRFVCFSLCSKWWSVILKVAFYVWLLLPCSVLFPFSYYLSSLY